MQINVTGKQLDIGDALRTHIETNSGGVIGMFLPNAFETFAGMERAADRQPELDRGWAMARLRGAAPI
jgi:hypothetical protein